MRRSYRDAGHGDPSVKCCPGQYFTGLTLFPRARECKIGGEVDAPGDANDVRRCEDEQPPHVFARSSLRTVSRRAAHFKAASLADLVTCRMQPRFHPQIQDRDCYQRFQLRNLQRRLLLAPLRHSYPRGGRISDQPLSCVLTLHWRVSIQAAENKGAG